MLCVSYRFCCRMVTRLRGLLTVLLVTSKDLLGYQGGKEADKMTSDYVSCLDTKSLGSRTKLEWWPASVCSVGFQFWGGWGIILRRTVMPGGVPLCRQPTKTKQTPLKALFEWAQLLSLQDLLCQGEPRDSSDSWGSINVESWELLNSLKTCIRSLTATVASLEQVYAWRWKDAGEDLDNL